MTLNNNPFLPSADLQNPDTLPVQKTSAHTLDLDQVRQHIQQAQERGRLHGPTDPMEYLLHKKCLVQIGGDYYATMAGIICFGRDPQASFPRAVIDIGHYRGVEAITNEVVHLEKNIGGTIFDQLRRLEDYLWSNIHHGMADAASGMQRLEVHEYPRIVIRELGANLLAHRDYTNYVSAARVFLYQDRIEWISPGGLTGNLTVETLLEGQAARNPAILSILVESGYVEAIGQGLDTVVATLRRERMEQPKFRNTEAFFSVTVYSRHRGQNRTEVLAGPMSPEKQRILDFVRRRGVATIAEIADMIDERGLRTVQRDVRELVEVSLLRKIGKGQATRYVPYEAQATVDD